MHFLKAIRYQNLLMLALMQLIFRYGFLKLQGFPLALYDWEYFLLVFSTVCIAAGGYLINNIFDQQTDRENKPDDVIIGKTISESRAYNYYFALNVVGVGIGFYLSNLIGRPSFALLFILISGTLYLYASSFKQSLLIGNFIVAVLLSVSIIIIGIYDLYPVLSLENRAVLSVVFRVILDYAIFAFMLNFMREIVKDLEDVDGDYNQGMNTLPIALGVFRTSRVVFFMSVIPIAVLLYYTNTFFIANNLLIATAYMLLFVVGPLIYFTIKIWSAKTKKEFHHLSNVLKVVILFGIFSILVVSLNVKYNA